MNLWGASSPILIFPNDSLGEVHKPLTIGGNKSLKFYITHKSGAKSVSIFEDLESLMRYIEIQLQGTGTARISKVNPFETFEQHWNIEFE